MLPVPVVNTYFPVIRFPEPATPLTVCGLPIIVPLEKNATVPVGALPKLGRAAVPSVRFAVRVTLPPDAILVALGVTATVVCAGTIENVKADDVLPLKL
jgi:hypothetical protein